MDNNRHYTQERVQLASVYPGKNWVKKVTAMSDYQVHETLVSILKKKEKEHDTHKRG